MGHDVALCDWRRCLSILRVRSFCSDSLCIVALRDISDIHGSLHEATLPQYVPPFSTLHMGYGSLNTALERDGAGVNRKKGRGGERRELERKEKERGGEGRGKSLDPTRRNSKVTGGRSPWAAIHQQPYSICRGPHQAFPVFTSTFRPERTSREKGNW